MSKFVGPDEVISALRYFMDRIVPAGVKNVLMFADNCAAQNKNSFLFAAIQAIVNERFEKFVLQFPTPGHSRMAADADFGKIVMKRKSVETVYGPSEWIKLIEESNATKPFKTYYLEKACNNTMSMDGREVIRVCDFKAALESKTNRSLTGITKIRRIAFAREVKPTILDATSPDLIGTDFSLLDLKTTPAVLRKAFRCKKLKYNKFRPVSDAKLNDIKSLMRFALTDDLEIFYNSIPKMVPSRRRNT